MGSARRTLLGMGAFAIVSLLLGVLRELVIARDLQASGAADLFFRGLTVVGASRAITLSVLRARWIPLGPGADPWMLARRELRSVLLVTGASLVVLVAVLGPDPWREPTAWVFVSAILLSVAGSVVRALAERSGHELRAYALEWALPIGAIVGAASLGRGALGPAVGTTAGLLAGLLVLAPAAFGSVEGRDAPPPPSARTRWLLLDTLTYVNLGLLDSAISGWVFEDGGLALLNYGYLFVNAALLIPSAAATIVSLRIAGTEPETARGRLRGWAALGGALVGGVVLAGWLSMGWAPVEAAVDGAAGWPITQAIRPIVLYSVPFAALRLANTVGRQWLVAHDPRRLAPWDLLGVTSRAAILLLAASSVGVLASPIGLFVAELLQLPAWVRAQRPATA